jgi:hypothetical protein
MIEFHLADKMRELSYTLSGIAPLSLSAFKKTKQQLKFVLAMQASKLNPAIFHHFNRNKKYK